MPNWCQNILNIAGPKKDLREFKKKSPNGQFRLQTYHPMPEELRDTTAPQDTPNWYNWAVSNWGTKWDVGGRRTKMKITGLQWWKPHQTLNTHDYLIRVCFDSAWAPPIEGIQTISKDYPSLTFILKYAECGMGFAGTEVFKHGDLAHHEEGDCNEYLNGEDFDEYY